MAQTTHGTQGTHGTRHGAPDTPEAPDTPDNAPNAAPRLNTGQATTRGAQNSPDSQDSPDAQDANLVERVAQEREPRQHALRRGRFLLAGYLVVLIVVAVLTLAAHTFSVLPGDLPFTRELQETTNPLLAGTMTFISAIGYPVQSAILLVVAVIMLWVIRLRLEALFMIVSLLADALSGLLKILVGRHRPLPSLVHVMQPLSDGSFPSGHTLHYTVFYGFLIFVVATNFRPSWPRTTAIVILAIPIALIGLSRVYLGEHWVTDVVGGYLIGALCLVPLIMGYMWTKQRFAVATRPPFLRRL
ncbi:MAG TPA: phosphatase PAP2 family protein [Ktedonobacterales bacterium]|nr:phosphatase PAP2 family protein [Ktedonobacterales bacterium]